MKVFSKAFTLAEVLLALAIIGVIAALTIPAIITKVTKDQYVVGLKKAYNTLKGVEREARQENGPMENWNWTGDLETTFEEYFKPHFDILKDCGATTEAGCFPAEKTLLDGNPWSAQFNTTSYYRIVTSDGMAWLYAKDSNQPPGRQALIYIDVNGLKSPNRYGRDIFAFSVYPSNLGIKPHGAYANATGLPMTSSAIDSGCTNNGYCAAKVLSEGAMNY